MPEIPADMELTYEKGWWFRKNYRPQDWTLIESVYRGDEYELEKLTITRDDDSREVIVDIGACIGAFSRLAHKRNPRARIVSVEVHPWNIPCLSKNVGGFAKVISGACTYEPKPALLSSIFEGSLATGGSTIQPQGIAENDRNPIYRYGQVEIDRAITLEEIIAENDLDYIDILKLDCEGSEYSILGNTTSLDRVGVVLGEYHGGQNRFRDLAYDVFPPDKWFTVIHHRVEHMGHFWFYNRRPPIYA